MAQPSNPATAVLRKSECGEYYTYRPAASRTISAVSQTWVKSRRMRWGTLMKGIENPNKSMVGKPQGKTPNERP
jgi:hypothetical protein